MKILTAAQMRLCDEATFNEVGVPERVIVENAGRAAAMWLMGSLPEAAENGVVVLCGPGHNGADGFAAARALMNLGVPVTAFSPEPTMRSSEVWKQCRRAFMNSGGFVTLLDDVSLEPELFGAGVVLDCLFGTGFTAPVREESAAVIDLVNSRKRDGAYKVVSIDLPSGLDADVSSVSGLVIESDYTLALQALKHCHVFPPSAAQCGEVHLLDAGIDMRGAKMSPTLLRRGAVSGIVQRFYSTADVLHKGSRGHVVLIGGAQGRVGAVKLSAEGALRIGSGLATIVLPQNEALKTSPDLLEVMCRSLPGDSAGGFSGVGVESLSELLNDKDALVIGPGIGTDAGALAVLRQAISSAKTLGVPAVLDADALNLLSAEPGLLDELNENFVLTPHPLEMGRLLGKSAAEVNGARLASAEELVRRSSAVVVLKGCRSVAAAPARSAFVNPFCVQTLATAGSGDLLSGVIAGLLGRGFPPFEAALAGMYLHGEAGEFLLAKHGGPAGVVASDIGAAVGIVINQLLAERPLPQSFSSLALKAISSGEDA